MDATILENPGSGSLSGIIDTLGQISGAVGETVGTAIKVRANIDSLASAREDRQFQQYLRGQELEVARRRADIGSQVEILKAQGALEEIRAKFSAAPIRWDYVLIAGAIAVGVYALVKLAPGE